MAEGYRIIGAGLSPFAAGCLAGLRA